MRVDLYPTKCNICGGKVIYTTNDKVYHRKYGSGYCYLCTECGAYVGTHKPRPKEALGMLADADMRLWKMYCHDVFDTMWKTQKQRTELYKWLAKEMQCPLEECHFGHFDLEQLKKAYKILMEEKERQLSE